MWSYISLSLLFCVVSFPGSSRKQASLQKTPALRLTIVFGTRGCKGSQPSSGLLIDQGLALRERQTGQSVFWGVVLSKW